jgi:hypothetical protein
LLSRAKHAGRSPKENPQTRKLNYLANMTAKQHSSNEHAAMNRALDDLADRIELDALNMSAPDALIEQAVAAELRWLSLTNRAQAKSKKRKE